MERDERLMRKALLLAAGGRGRVEPNPVVGAVVASGFRTLGYGYHAAWGGPHAEVAALDRAGEAARGATLYVTLEPCSHRGKTPPCTERILAAGVSRVVYAAADPNPLTAGRGPEQLRAAGVEVTAGVLEGEARAMNRRFETHLGSDLPFTIAKWAMTLDGRIADVEGGSKYITGPASRRLVHEVRGAVDAVVVGIGTALADDPMLTAREVPAYREPLRVVVDGSLRLPPDSRLAATAGAAPVLVATREDAPAEREAALAAKGVRVLRAPAGPGGVDLGALFRRLKAEEGVRRILLEGGGEMLASAFAAGVVHQVMAFTAPIVLGGRSAPGPVGGDGFRRIADPLRLEEVRTTALGDDMLVEGFVPAG